LADSIDFSEWLEYFADGILDELRRVRKTLPDHVAPQPRLEPHHHMILNYIRKNGSITQREYGEISSRSLASRKVDFDKLLKLKLIGVKGVGRGTYYVLSTPK
jgi:predicted HTH transcriptional regulator